MKKQDNDIKKLPRKRFQFRQLVVLLSDQKNVKIEAEDQAGNATHATLPVPGQRVPQRTAAIKLAYLDDSSRDIRSLFPATEESAQTEKPHLHSIKNHFPSPTDLRLHLKGIKDKLTAYYDSLYVEGSITGPSPILSLAINGDELLDRKGRNIFFSYQADLEEGQNTIEITASDENGEQVHKQINVLRIIPKIFSLSQRMRLSLLPLQPAKGSKEKAALVTDDLLIALIRQQRFHMVERERLEAILEELHLASSKLIEEKSAVRIGRVLAAEGAMMGSIYETSEAIEVVASLVDTETEEILLTKDIFSEDKSFSGIHNMMEGLSYKFRQGLPLVEGTILKTERKTHFLNLGKENGILRGQKVIFFRQGPEIRHPETQLFLGREWEIVSEGRIKEVYEEASEVMATKRFPSDGIRPGDLVITK